MRSSTVHRNSRRSDNRVHDRIADCLASRRTSVCGNHWYFARERLANALQTLQVGREDHLSCSRSPVSLYATGYCQVEFSAQHSCGQKAKVFHYVQDTKNKEAGAGAGAGHQLLSNRSRSLSLMTATPSSRA